MKDECELERDVDGVHESLGTARRSPRTAPDRPSRRRSPSPDGSGRARQRTLRVPAQCYNRITIRVRLTESAARPDGGVAVAGAGLASRRSEARDGSDPTLGSNLLLCARGAHRRQHATATSTSIPRAPGRTATSPPIAASLAELGAGIRGIDDRLAVRPDSIALADAVTAWSAVNGAGALGGELGGGRDGNEPEA